jgi:hypothetical protein
MIPTPSWPMMVAGFMPGIVPRIRCRSVPQMGREAHDGIRRGLELRFGDVIKTEIPDPMQYHGFHANVPSHSGGGLICPPSFLHSHTLCVRKAILEPTLCQLHQWRRLPGHVPGLAGMLCRATVRLVLCMFG